MPLIKLNLAQPFAQQILKAIDSVVYINSTLINLLIVIFYVTPSF